MSMNADGSNRTQIYNSIFKAGSGSWFSTILTPDVSPDGKTIAVVSARPVRSQQQQYPGLRTGRAVQPARGRRASSRT